MKQLRFLALISLLALASWIYPAISQADIPTNPVLTRDVFVHFPRGFEARPGGGGGGSGSTCPDPNTCRDNKTTGYVWPASAALAGIHYTVDTTGSGLSDSEVVNAVEAGFTVWQNSSLTDGDANSISFINDGLGSVADPNTSDAVNSVTFRDITASYSNAIGVTYAWHYLGSKAIIETDTIFNTGSGFAWSTTGDATRYDLQNIAAHEFGHWLQLGDLYKSQDNQLTMYGYGAKGETLKRDLGYGDILGVQKLY